MQNKHESDRNRQKMLRDLGLLSVIIADLLGYTGAGLAIGWYAWKNWGAPMWLMAVLSLIGLILAMVKIFKITKMDWDQNGK